MGQTLMFYLLLLASLSDFYAEGITEVTKAIKDVAVLSCDHNIPTIKRETFRIYWQKNNEVVLTVTFGKVEVGPEYKNRTFIDITSNLSIVILALRPSDSGIYNCIVQKPEESGYRVEHFTSVKLSVRAAFPIPTINDHGNPSTNIKRINCSTSGGFPKPYLSWFANGKELNAINTVVSQDLETKLYTITSELDFNVTYSHNFTCSVKSEDVTVSQNFSWQATEPPPSPPFHLSKEWLVILIVVLLVFVIAVIIIYIKCSPNTCASKPRKKRSTEHLEMYPV